MALSPVATKPKVTSKAKTSSKPKVTKQTLVDTLLKPTNPYELLSERISSLDTKIDSTKNELLTEIKNTHTRIDGLEKSLNGRIDATNTRIDNLEKNLSGRIDNLEKSINHRIDDLKSSFAWGNAIIALTIAAVGLGIALLQIL